MSAIRWSLAALGLAVLTVGVVLLLEAHEWARYPQGLGLPNVVGYLTGGILLVVMGSALAVLPWFLPTRREPKDG